MTTKDTSEKQQPPQQPQQQQPSDLVKSYSDVGDGAVTFTETITSRAPPADPPPPPPAKDQK